MTAMLKVSPDWHLPTISSLAGVEHEQCLVTNGDEFHLPGPQESADAALDEYLAHYEQYNAELLAEAEEDQPVLRSELKALEERVAALEAKLGVV